MAKVVVVDVDLGIDIESIIRDSAKALTRDAKNELDEAVAVMESAKRLKDEEERKKIETVNNMENAILKAYMALESAGPKGIKVDDIMSQVKTFIPNSSAFSLRMNNLLSKKGNPYRLIRLKVDGSPHYVFTPFNVQS